MHRRLLLAAVVTGVLVPTVAVLPAASARPRAVGGAPTGTASPLLPPPVPPPGRIYLGAWVQPGGSGQSTDPVLSELNQVGNFQTQLGRPLALVHAYQSWTFPLKNATLAALASSGAIPIVDWACGVADADIVSGKDDAFITAYAQQLKAYAKPVFLRWLWEPNLPNQNTTCITTSGPDSGAAGYVAAWQHIFNIFRGPAGVGASNVSFVWNPGMAGITTPSVLQSFYPGTNYVDWVGIDGYSRPTATPPNPTFATLFNRAPTHVYTTLASYGKPMMIGETGSTAGNQATYLAGAAASLGTQTFQQVHAFVYYDGTNVNLGDNGAWTLVATGLQALAQMAGSALFSAMG